MREDGLGHSSHSCPLFLPVQEWSKLPFLPAMSCELLYEWFIVERPLDVLGLAKTMSKNAVGRRKKPTLARRGFSSSSSTEVLTESAFSMHRAHAPGNSSLGMSTIWTSLTNLCEPKSGAKIGGVGFWNEAEVAKTSAALFSNAGST